MSMIKNAAVLGCALLLSQLTHAFDVKSDQIQPQAMMNKAQEFNGFGCTGKNQSPSLRWSGVPEGTKSFAVMAYDPDAPTGSGWWHWVVFNIPADVRTLPVNAGDPTSGLMPAGAVQSRTDYGVSGFGGACPPVGHGKHRYQFRVIALDVETLPLDENATAALVGYMVNQHALGEGKIEALYER